MPKETKKNTKKTANKTTVKKTATKHETKKTPKEVEQVVEKEVIKEPVKKEKNVKKAGLTQETKKSLVLLGIAALIVLAIPVIAILDYQKSKDLLEEYRGYLASEKMEVVLLARPGCYYCQQFKPVIDQVKETYGVDYHYVNTDTLRSTHLVEILNTAEIEPADFGTPTTLLVQNNEVVDILNGLTDLETLFLFYQEHGLIASDVAVPDETPNLTKIDYSQYEELLASGQRFFVSIVQTGCDYCKAELPVLNELAGTYGFPAYVLNITKMTSEEKTNLMSSVTYLRENSKWGTPLNLVIENGDNVAYSNGFVNEETLVTFLQEQGFIVK